MELRSHAPGFSPAESRTPPLRAAPACPLETTLLVLGGRWRPLVLWRLFWGSKSFADLIRGTPGIPKKALRYELAELERYGLVRLEMRPYNTRREEYSLTPFGETLKPLVAAMYEWGLYVQTDGRNLPPDLGQVLP